MNFTRSTRELRLWWGVAAVQSVVWASVFTAGSLAPVLRIPGLLEISFSVGLLLVGVAIAVSGWTRGHDRADLWIRIAAVAVLGMLVVRSGVPAAARTHLFEFGVTALLIEAALRERIRSGGRVPFPGLLAIGATALLGWLDEGLQALHPDRVYDPWDIVVDATAAVIAVVAVRVVSGVERALRRGATPAEGVAGGADRDSRVEIRNDDIIP